MWPVMHVQTLDGPNSAVRRTRSRTEAPSWDGAMKTMSPQGPHLAALNALRNAVGLEDPASDEQLQLLDRIASHSASYSDTASEYYDGG